MLFQTLRSLFSLLPLAALLIHPAAAQQTSPLTVEQIMQDPETWIGAWPSQVRWGARGDYLYFDWNPKGRFESDSLYRVPRAGGAPEKVPPSERRAGLTFFDGWHHGAHVYNQDLQRKVYARDGDLFLFDHRKGSPLRLTETRAEESGPRFSPDGQRVIYARENNLYALTLATGATRQLTDLRKGEAPPDEEPKGQGRFLVEQQQTLFETLREERREEQARDSAEARERRADDPPPTYYVGEKEVQQLRLDPTGHFVTFALYAPPKDAQQTAVLNFVTETGYAEELTARPKVGSPDGTQTLYVQDLKRDTTFAVDFTTLPGADERPAYLQEKANADSSFTRAFYAYGPFWSAGGEHGVLEVRARDNKDRWIARLDAETGALTTLNRQHDDAWIAGPGISWFGGPSSMGWLPDNRRFYFQSEASGYSHLYTVDVETGETQQLTEGDFEVLAPQLSQDGRTWFFVSSEGSPFERHVYQMPAGGGPRTRLTNQTGRIEAFALSPDARRLGLLQSYTNRPPEVYLHPVSGAVGAHRDAPSPPIRITHSTTDAWAAYAWRVPELLRFEASDGAQVPAQVFRPDGSNGAAVLFVHGAGYLQNVHRGWSSYFREYMFHNLLADLGYTVMNVDYRASSGYGRDWRTAVSRHMGGRDLQDYVDAQGHLEAEYGLPPERTFIYGGSYGGFITLMALFTEPEHFGGGAALRSVTDWAHYNDPYTSNILNTPQTDSLAYARSSPIYFAEGLEDPLLMAHGLIDQNVQPQDIFRLSQRLIELGKEDWELALYPVEGHSFAEPSSWADEYRRILELIERSVGPDAEAQPALDEAAGGR